MAKPVRKKIRKSNKPCKFCVGKIEPDYKDLKGFEESVSAKQRIVSRWETGFCEKHQKRVSVAIKRARHLGLVSFTDRA
jgi:small subunit ribosomal protein S18